jgi:hypothetical protein
LHSMTIGRIPSVEGGIQPTIVDAKGDLIAATAADTVNRLAVGSNDQILVADSSTSTGLAWKSNATPFAAGKNKIINGDFAINQRGFTSTTSLNVFAFDRFDFGGGAFTSGLTISAQTFTPGAAPVAGYESTNYLRAVTLLVGAGTTTQVYLRNRIEDVRTFAGQTMTVSFWAKADSGTPNLGVRLEQDFGSGGSSSVFTLVGAVTAISTSWARYSFTLAVPSISGKTVGAGSHLELRFYISAGASVSDVGAVGNQDNFEFWGFQAEQGSVATAFQTATGTPQGELAACQRYYWRTTLDENGDIALGTGSGTTKVYVPIPCPVFMRVEPTSVDYANLRVGDFTNAAIDVTSLTLLTTSGSSRNATLEVNVASGITAYRPYSLRNNSSFAGYVGLSAEL